MFGLKSITVDGAVLASAVEQYLKSKLTDDAQGFVVMSVDKPVSYSDEFKITFGPSGAVRPDPDFE